MNKIKTILLDLDGVLANCQDALLKILKLENDPVAYRQTDLGSYMGLTKDEFWDKVETACKPDSLFAKLPAFKSANNLIKLCKMYSDNVVICSVVGPHTQGFSDKANWIREHLEDKEIPIMLLSNRHKELLANESTLLIDDFMKNCISFRNAGGMTILYPASYNKNYEHMQKPLSFVKQELDKIVGNEPTEQTKE